MLGREPSKNLHGLMARARMAASSSFLAHDRAAGVKQSSGHSSTLPQDSARARCEVVPAPIALGDRELSQLREHQLLDRVSASFPGGIPSTASCSSPWSGSVARCWPSPGVGRRFRSALPPCASSSRGEASIRSSRLAAFLIRFDTAAIGSPLGVCRRLRTALTLASRRLKRHVRPRRRASSACARARSFRVAAASSRAFG